MSKDLTDLKVDPITTCVLRTLLRQKGDQIICGAKLLEGCIDIAVGLPSNRVRVRVRVRVGVWVRVSVKVWMSLSPSLDVGLTLTLTLTLTHAHPKP